MTIKKIILTALISLFFTSQIQAAPYWAQKPIQCASPKEVFDRLINNKCFTPIEDWKSHDPNQQALLKNKINVYPNPASSVINLSLKLTAKDIAIYKASDVYYSKKTNLGKTFRNFHNFVKSQYIYNYCSITEDKKMDVLDIGIGQGGDLLKYFHSRVRSITGIDVDADGLFSAGSESAIGRLMQSKKVYPNFPPTDLIHASFGINLMKPELQYNGLPNMTEQNKKLISKINS